MTYFRQVNFRLLNEKYFGTANPERSLSPRLRFLYDGLDRIKAILEDDTLDDDACFQQVEALDNLLRAQCRRKGHDLFARHLNNPT